MVHLTLILLGTTFVSLGNICEETLALLVPNLLQTRQVSIAQFADSEPFQRYLKEKDVSNFAQRPKDAQEKLLSDFAASTLLPVLQDLPRQQEKSLTSALVHLGVSGGYAELARLSTQNRVRHTPQYPTGISAADVEAERGLADRLQIQFIHNSHHFFSRYSPLLSAEQISKLGVLYGTQIKLEFNRDDLGTADQIFFHSNVVWRDKADFRPFKSEYGDYGLYVHPDYASKKGWISPFVMYPNQLIRAWSYTDRDSFETFRQYYRNQHETQYRLYEKSGARFEDFPYVESTMDEFFQLNADKKKLVLSSLSRLVFTYDDYRGLLVDQLAMSLARLRKSDQGRYALISNAIAKKLDGPLAKELSSLIFAPLGIPEQFEMKVPVAVPTEHFTVVKP